MNSNKIKLLFIHDGPVYSDNTGRIYGIHFTDEIFERYKYLGDEIIFLTRVYPLIEGNLSKVIEINLDNIKVIGVPNFKNFTKYYYHRKAILKTIISAINDSDIVLLRMPSGLSTLAFNEVVKSGKPFMNELTACTFDTYWNYSWKGKLIAPIKYFHVRWMIRRSPFTLYVTDKFLQSRYPSKGITLGCSDVDLCRTEINNLEYRIEDFKLKDLHKGLVFGTVGTLDVKYKGQVYVIKAIARLIKMGINAYYIIVGQGDSSKLMKKILKYNIQDRVEIRGPLKHDEIFSFYKEIDVYIHPSKTEGLPRVIVEAMSMSCPVIATDVGGIPELIEKKMLFKKGSSKDIINKIIKLDNNLLIEQSIRNYKESGRFETGKLNEKRIRYYNLFLSNNNIINTSNR